jgi:hypothetical protein
LEAPLVKENLLSALVLFTSLSGLGLLLGGTVRELWADDPVSTTRPVLDRGRTIETGTSSILPAVPWLLSGDSMDAANSTLFPFGGGSGTSSSLLRPGQAWNPARVQTQSDGEWGSVTSRVVLTDPIPTPGRSWEDPLHRQEWKCEDAWKMDLPGPLFVFGQVGANSGPVGATDMKLTGKTGLACKFPLWDQAEVQVRSGPSFTCTDPLNLDPTTVHSAWLLQLQASCPLAAGVGLQYDCTASPAMSAQERDQMTHDLSLAFPMGSSGKVRLGARHKWEAAATQQPLADSMEVYLGVELSR